MSKYFFFVKQKTAYEMRISDWSSDVCSSDLDAGKRIFVERMARHRGRLDLSGHLHEALRIAALLQGDQGLGDVLQAGGFPGAAAKTHHAETDTVQLATLGDAALQFVDHVADLIDVRLHRHGGVHHQHHGGTERVS